MCFAGPRCLTAVACIVISFTSVDTYANGTSAVDDVRSALADMHRWVDAGPYGEDWRAYLHSQQLEELLAQGAQADPAAVGQIRDRYASGAAGLELPPPVKVRMALDRWLVELSPTSIDRLPQAIRAVKARFVPVAKDELDKARDRLGVALDRLDARLTAAGPGGQPWRDYLRWDVLRSELSRGDEANLSKLEKIYFKFDSGHEGLDLYWFSDVRGALRDYLTAAGAIGAPRLKEDYAALLDGLAGQVEKVGKVPTAQQTAVVTDAIRWLQDARQAEGLIWQIRRCFARPNLLGQVSADVIRAGIDRPVDDTGPVEDVILGTVVRGTARTTGRIIAELLPNSGRAEIEVVFRGTTKSDTIGYNGPARIYSDGTTTLSARKIVRLDEQGARAAPSAGEAETRSEVTGIGLVRGGRVVQRVVQKRVDCQKGEADRIAASHAGQQISRRVDAEVGRAAQQASENLDRKFRQPLLVRRLFPEQFQTSTTAVALHFVALEADDGQLGAPAAPPPFAGEPDLGLQIHESMVNNFFARALAGQIVPDERFQAAVIHVLGKLPKELQSDENAEPWTIDFAHYQPVFASFADGKFALSIRGRSFAKGEGKYPAMDVTAQYEILKTSRPLKAVRQGELKIFPPDFVPGGGQRLSVREQVIRDMLQRRFEKIFTEEIIPKPLTLPDPWSAAGEMSLSQWETRDGWMVLGWKRTEAAGAAPPAGPAR